MEEEVSRLASEIKGEPVSWHEALTILNTLAKEALAARKLLHLSEEDSLPDAIEKIRNNLSYLKDQRDDLERERRGRI
jgi:hypothetical protein